MSQGMTEMPPLSGLLLAGGRSKRMGRDKAGLATPEGPIWKRTYHLLQNVCADAYISVRPEQALPDFNEPESILLPDKFADAGPLAGILTAFDHAPDHAWLVLACDLPLLDESTLQKIVQSRQTDLLGTTYQSNFDGLPEPLCTIYEPAAADVLRSRLRQERFCPRRFLMDESARVSLIQLDNPHALENANTPEDLARIQQLAS